MATPELASKPKHKSRSEKKAQAAQSASVDKLKTVVRRLPPNLPEDIFWQSVQPWVTDDSVSWRAFYQGKITKKYNKENVPSRAYIAFRSAEQLAVFSRAYDGHLFRDKAGNESFAVVEFAPSQKAPPEKRKVDTRMGTIDQDEDYISFLATLNAPPSKPSETDTLEALIAASQPPPPPKSTPLLDALRAEKQAQRDRETILKAHAHYREDPGSRRRGKQPQVVPPVERDEAAPGPGQGKRRRGKKAEAAATLPAKAKDKEGTPAGPAKTIAKAAPKPTAPVASASTSTAQTPSPAAAPAKEGAKEAPRERRARPAIGIGLASRQFEAALNGVGGGADRKPRRGEKKAGEASPAGTDGAQKVAEKEKAAGDKQAPTSPGKDRNRGNRKRGNTAKSPTSPAAGGLTEGNAGTMETILARTGGQPGILARPAPATSDTPASAPAPTPAATVAKQGGGHPPAPGEGRGGRRRGGRGRGTPAGQTARGGAPDGAP